MIEDGEMDGCQGYWCEDEETGEEGFLQESEDVFWLFDEDASAWMVRRFTGRTLRRGPRKGKGVRVLIRPDVESHTRGVLLLVDCYVYKNK